jgi:hypothetical protein
VILTLVDAGLATRRRGNQIIDDPSGPDTVAASKAAPEVVDRGGREPRWRDRQAKAAAVALFYVVLK